MTEASAPLSHRNRWGIPANGGPIDLRRAADPRPAVLSASPRDVVLDLARTAVVLVNLRIHLALGTTSVRTRVNVGGPMG